jgi:hypothetical protein
MQSAASEIQVKASFDAILSCLRMNSVAVVKNDYQKFQVNCVAMDAEIDNKVQVGVAESDRIQVGVAYDNVIEGGNLDAVVTSTSMISVRAIYQESNLAKNRNIIGGENVSRGECIERVGCGDIDTHDTNKIENGDGVLTTIYQDSEVHSDSFDNFMTSASEAVVSGLDDNQSCQYNKDINQRSRQINDVIAINQDSQCMNSVNACKEFAAHSDIENESRVRQNRFQFENEDLYDESVENYGDGEGDYEPESESESEDEDEDKDKKSKKKKTKN